MFAFEDTFAFDDALSIQNSVRFGIWDLPNGPEPGPEMPKRKKPKIV